MTFSKQIWNLIVFAAAAGAAYAGTVSMYPGSVDFGRVFLGNVAYNGPFVQNLSNKPVAISNIQITGDFTIQTTTCGSVIPPQYQCNFTLLFTPTAGGTRTGTLSMTVDSGDGTLKEKLTGVGVPVQLVSISATPPTASIIAGFQASFQAPGAYNNSTMQYPPVTWSSSDLSVATVDAYGVVTGVSPGTVSIIAAYQGISGSATVTVTPNAFRPTGSMTLAREGHTSTLLPEGQVLIAGGWGYQLPDNEVYDRLSASFTPTGAMSIYRTGHTATLLKNGKVLIAGGGYYGALSSAEIYDPATGAFTTTGAMSTARYSHTATLLQDGRVLIAGGFNTDFVASAEVYDPVTGVFMPAGNMSSPRSNHIAALLPDGRVLIAGGHCFCGSTQRTSAAELFNPVTGLFIPTGSLVDTQEAPTAAVLGNGKVLVADVHTNLTELYDAASGLFSITGSLSTVHFGSITLTPFANGKVLLTGGTSPLMATGEMYDPAVGVWTPVAGAMATSGGAATLLSNGSVLISGGYDRYGDPSPVAYLYIGSN